jgi:hypothetical protein
MTDGHGLISPATVEHGVKGVNGAEKLLLGGRGARPQVHGMSPPNPPPRGEAR